MSDPSLKFSFPAAQDRMEGWRDPAFQASLTTTILPAYLPRQRWFTSKGKDIGSCRVTHLFPITESAVIYVCELHFTDGSREAYQVPLAILQDSEVARSMLKEQSHLVLAKGDGPLGELLLVDAVVLPDFRLALYQRIRADLHDGAHGLTSDSGKILQASPETVSSVVPSIDSSNTAIVYHDRLFFKLFRKLDPGLNPDLELTRYLSEDADFGNSPAYGGSLSIAATPESAFINLGIMIGKVENEGDAWEYFQELTKRFYANVLSTGRQADAPPRFEPVSDFRELPSTAAEMLDEETFRSAALLGKRSGEMHLALAAADRSLPDMMPETFSADYRKEILEAAVRLLDRQFKELEAKLPDLSPSVRRTADKVLSLRQEILTRIAGIENVSANLEVCRIHADYHLGQVLKTTGDFVIIDFEGEPLLSIPERRRKRPPFKDVAGMIRSFHYAAMGQLLLNEQYDNETRAALTPWGSWWFRHIRHVFLTAYLTETAGSKFVPPTAREREDLLDFFVLEKAVYETAYELNSRPTWLPIPLDGMLFALLDNQGV